MVCRGVTDSVFLFLVEHTVLEEPATDVCTSVKYSTLCLLWELVETVCVFLLDWDSNARVANYRFCDSGQIA